MKLGISIIIGPYFVLIKSLEGALLVQEEVMLDGYAAVRRAITRAAAAIGTGAQDE